MPLPLAAVDHLHARQERPDHLNAALASDDGLHLSRVLAKLAGALGVERAGNERATALGIAKALDRRAVGQPIAVERGQPLRRLPPSRIVDRCGTLPLRKQEW